MLVMYYGSYGKRDVLPDLITWYITHIYIGTKKKFSVILPKLFVTLLVTQLTEDYYK